MITILSEKKYYAQTNKNHIKNFGQYFTPYKIADFMAKWCGTDAGRVLDPAVGNSIFFRMMQKYYPNADYIGYEIDEKIADFFKANINYKLNINDFLLSSFEETYDSIICNPPYNKFQLVSNREDIINHFYKNTGLQMSLYTNHYIYFLIKCLFQLNDNGKLAFIIPHEFLNSKYGEKVKEILIHEKYLHSIINLDFKVFDSAITTSCILLVEKKKHNEVNFITIQNIDELASLEISGPSVENKKIKYSILNHTDKWTKFLYSHDSNSYKNLVKLSEVAKVNRGIATGANKFFTLNKKQLENLGLSLENVTPCITSSTYIKSAFFTRENLDSLINSNSNIFLLDIDAYNISLNSSLMKYIKYGEEQGYDKKYLPSKRRVWYTMEKQIAPPILLSTAFRDHIKVVRNIAEIKHLTTFHGLKMNEEYKDYTDILFCYLLTNIGQKIILENKKVLGNGLIKFQPNDYNNSQVLDFKVISSNDITEILEIYKNLFNNVEKNSLSKLNSIFSKYLIDKGGN